MGWPHLFPWQETNRVTRAERVDMAARKALVVLDRGGGVIAGGGFAGRAEMEPLQQSFLQPPEEARIMVRWWWFGPAVTERQLEREMKRMKEGGIGGFEVQPTYPLAVDGELPGRKNLKFLSPEFLEAIRFTARKAKELGLRMDLTLGSGWPYGGPQFSAGEGAGRLVTQVVQVPAGQRSVPVPTLRDGQSLIAAFVGKGNSGLTAVSADAVAAPASAAARSTSAR